YPAKAEVSRLRVRLPSQRGFAMMHRSQATPKRNPTVFFEPSPTPHDISWRMFGTQVRVSPWFWLITVLLGWSTTHRGFVYLVVWVAWVLVSVLVHEFGHVMMGRIFGTDGHIVLFGLGGLAIGSNAISNRWQRIAVSFAGPGAGFLLLAAVLA